MTRVDFYVLPEASEEGPLPTACRLCEKAVASGQRVHVHVPDGALATELDRLLWVYRQGSFVSHERAGVSADADLASVLIGADAPPPPQREVLLNLAPEVPPFFEGFERVLEIVAGDAATRGASRERFRFYKGRGLAPETHTLT